MSRCNVPDATFSVTCPYCIGQTYCTSMLSVIVMTLQLYLCESESMSESVCLCVGTSVCFGLSLARAHALSLKETRPVSIAVILAVSATSPPTPSLAASTNSSGGSSHTAPCSDGMFSSCSQTTCQPHELDCASALAEHASTSFAACRSAFSVSIPALAPPSILAVHGPKATSDEVSSAMRTRSRNGAGVGGDGDCAEAWEEEGRLLEGSSRSLAGVGRGVVSKRREPSLSTCSVSRPHAV